LRHIPWARGAELGPAELAALAPSLQDFQLGESSDGHELRRVARAWVARGGDPAYLTALDYFIGEEQRHGRDLGRLLARAGVPLLRHSWTDSVFRLLRRRVGLEGAIAVLLTAEIVAQVYYPAVRAATRSAVLRRLCEQIIADEDAHVRFQSERLAIIRRARPAGSLLVAHGLQRAFFLGTLLVVWLRYAAAFRCGGLTFVSYWRATWTAFDAALRRMDPRTYAAAP
jgi:hypothetical protein